MKDPRDDKSQEKKICLEKVSWRGESRIRAQIVRFLQINNHHQNCFYLVVPEVFNTSTEYFLFPTQQARRPDNLNLNRLACCISG